MKNGASGVEAVWKVETVAKWIRDDIRGLGTGNGLRRWAVTRGSRALPDFYFRRLRTQMFRWMGCGISHGSTLLGHIDVSGPLHTAGRLQIGAGSLIGPGVKFDLEAEIVIGQNVAIGPQSVLFTSSHGLGAASRRMTTRVLAKPIIVEDGVWIGMGSMVLPGVRIGRGAVVSAGSVVTQSVEPNTLVAGNPAKVLKTLALGDR